MDDTELLRVFETWHDSSTDNDCDIYRENGKWKLCFYQGVVEQTVVHKSFFRAVESGLRKLGHI